MSTTSDAKPATKRPRKMAREPKADAPSEAEPKRSSKSDLVLDLLMRTEGSTLDELVAATGWLPHTARAALTGLKKKGHVVTSAKIDGAARIYRVATA